MRKTGLSRYVRATSSISPFHSSEPRLFPILRADLDQIESADTLSRFSPVPFMTSSTVKTL